MEQCFEKCLHFKETAKQDNPYLLRVGAFKIYCERKQTAKAVFFLSNYTHSRLSRDGATNLLQL